VIAALPRIDSSVTAEEAHALAGLANGRTVLEVGSWRGFSTVTMAQTAVRVHAVDWHQGDDHAGRDESLSHLIANLDEYGVRDRVVVHVGRADAVLPMFRPESFDFAFHDAFHETEAVAADAALILPLLRPGGVLAFHDYGLFGVAAAVDALDVEPLHVVGTLAVVRKR
jgi:predicted O-methyltransferase YrrM